MERGGRLGCKQDGSAFFVRAAAMQGNLIDDGILPRGVFPETWIVHARSESNEGVGRDCGGFVNPTDSSNCCAATREPPLKRCGTCRTDSILSSDE